MEVWNTPGETSDFEEFKLVRFIRFPHHSLARQVNLASGAPNCGEMVKSGLHSGWPIHPNTSGQTVPSQGPSILPAVVCSSSLPSVKPTKNRERRSTLPKLNVETCKTLRIFSKPLIGKPEEPQGGTEMPEVKGSNNDGKPASSHNLKTRGSLMLVTNATVLNLLASSTSSELQEESLVQRGTTSDVAACALKKSEASDFPQKGAKNKLLDEEPKVGGTNQIKLQNGSNYFLEDIGYRQNESKGIFDDETKEVAAEHNIQRSAMESGSEREEGELVPDTADVESGGNMSGLMESQEIGENQTEPSVSSPPAVADEEGLVSATMDSGETGSPPVLMDEADMTEANTKEGAADDSNEGNNLVAMEADQNLEAVPLLDPTGGRISTGTAAEGRVPKQGSPPSVTAETHEANQASPVGKSSGGHQ
ncbi:hypothetical protein RHMOL_Rhmol10G0000100 [Rhododendron molle]|uniref:Uncharacterized protein n=1 Tax=Rhododendron molle TaxID=49168 RepID=A0ACC0LXK7_RHOML|nr:hypothetical protein RHMOL_Rhmol10G0000100 [Rhododendron molle]